MPGTGGFCARLGRCTSSDTQPCKTSWPARPPQNPRLPRWPRARRRPACCHASTTVLAPQFRRELDAVVTFRQEACPARRVRGAARPGATEHGPVTVCLLGARLCVVRFTLGIAGVASECPGVPAPQRLAVICVASYGVLSLSLDSDVNSVCLAPVAVPSPPVLSDGSLGRRRALL